MNGLVADDWLPRVSDNVRQGPALQELHNDPELVSNQVAVVHVNHVLMVIVPHDHHLETNKSTNTGYMTDRQLKSEVYAHRSQIHLNSVFHNS